MVNFHKKHKMTALIFYQKTRIKQIVIIELWNFLIYHIFPMHMIGWLLSQDHSIISLIDPMILKKNYRSHHSKNRFSWQNTGFGTCDIVTS